VQTAFSDSPASGRSKRFQTTLLTVDTKKISAIGNTQSMKEIKLVNSYLPIKIDFEMRFFEIIAHFAQQYKYFFKKAIK
jgi:O-antigen ligase